MTRSTTLLRKDLLFRHIVHHAGSWQVMTVAVFALVTLQHRDAPRSDPGEGVSWVEFPDSYVSVALA
jgi:hypothetical protein